MEFYCSSVELDSSVKSNIGIGGVGVVELIMVFFFFGDVDREIFVDKVFSKFDLIYIFG